MRFVFIMNSGVITSKLNMGESEVILPLLSHSDVVHEWCLITFPFGANSQKTLGNMLSEHIL